MSSSTPYDQPEQLIGRDPELTVLGDLLAPAARPRIVALRGEAGCGKSAMAAIVAADWRATGGTVEAVDPGAPPRALESPGARRLLIADLSGPAAFPSPAAWQALVRSLRGEDRLLVLSREPLVMPVDDSRLFELRLGPLSDADATLLLAQEGTAEEHRPGLVRWAAGRPLRLVLGAQAVLHQPSWRPGAGPDPEALTERLERRGCAPDVPTDERVRTLGAPDTDRAEALAAAEQAIRDYQFPDRLSRSPLADGATPHERASGLQARIDDAIAVAFGASAGDAALREVLVAGYVIAAASHEQIAQDLFFSRSTYFRRLARATRRVATQLAEADVAQQVQLTRAA